VADPPDAAGPESREARLIAKMLRRVEAARGLASKHPVPGAVLDRPALLARVKEHLTRELPPEAIRNEGLALELFGFVPAGFPYEEAQYKLLEEQLAGYYEPADGTMYMAGDLGDAEAEATLAHELVHALQDQRWDLATRCKYQPGQGDRSEAVSALAEGDATSAMYDLVLARAPGSPYKSALDIPDETFADQIRAGVESIEGGTGAAAPRIMRTSLAAPYMYGTLFVHALRRRGGWPSVDRAWDDPPITTEQILHLDKWAAHEAPLEVYAPAHGTLGEGWTVADEDSEGELGTRLAFEEWVDPRTAAAISAGWGGDRGVLLKNGERLAFAWRLRYDAALPARAGQASKPSRAAEAFRKLKVGLEKLGKKPVVPDTPSFVCRERADRGPMAMTVAGDDLVLTFGPALTSPQGWQGAADCAHAKLWSREIAASR
jgi:hypothetical protein